VLGCMAGAGVRGIGMGLMGKSGMMR